MPAHRRGPPRPVWPPEAGWFRFRLVRGGWAVPAAIRQTDDGWSAVIDGFEHPPHDDPAHAEGVSDLWTYGDRIEQHEYDYLTALREHVRRADPSHPAANPHRAILPAMLRPILPAGHTPKDHRP
jgi:hypothetical protein